MTYKLRDAGYRNSHDHRVESKDKHDEVGVIVSANTRPKPYAVMIEFIYTVVAQVAVGGLRWTED